MANDVPGTVIVGVGNELLRDEGVGVIAARVLMNEKLPPGVEVVEGGVGGFDLVFELEGRERAIIIDAADMGAAPGTVRSFTLDEVDIEMVQRMASLHQVGLADVLHIGGMVGPMPEVHIIGVQPAEIAPGMGLSPEVGAAIPQVVAEAHRVLEERQ